MTARVYFRSDSTAELIHEYCMQDEEFIEHYGAEGCEMCEMDFAEYSYDRFCKYCLEKHNIEVILELPTI